MVGSDLLRYLKSNFQTVAAINRKNYGRYKGKRFDVVINANGNSNKVWAKNHVLSDFAASTTSVYQSLLDFPCKIYIYISSADVYVDHTRSKTTSEDVPIDPKSITSYGLHKYLSERIIQNFAKNYIILRCSMILGTKLKKGPAFDVLSNSHLFVGDKSAFQMITTEELGQIISFLLERNTKQEIFNIGGHGALTLSKISPMIKRRIIFPKNGETIKYEMDVSKLNKIYKLKRSKDYFLDLLKNYGENYNYKV